MKTKPAPKTRRTAAGQRERWAPRPPRIGLLAVQKLLLRHVVMVCPETRLWVAMISQAMGDAIGRDDNQRHRARRFLTSDTQLAFWCELLGIDLGFVREVAIKAGYLVDEDLLWQLMKPANAKRAPCTQLMTEDAHAGL
jgi:hypothetical protein